MRRILIGLVAFCLALAFAPVASAATYPTLDSFTLSSGSTYAQGDTASMDFGVTPGDSAISTVGFGYDGPCGSVWAIVAYSKELGTATNIVGVRTGTYTLQTVSVTNVFGDNTVYYRDGTVTTNGDPSTHKYTFAESDLSVGDPSISCVGPTLSDFNMVDKSFVQGDAVSVGYDAVAGDSPIQSIGFGYSSPCGTGWAAGATDSSGAVVSDTGERNGPYELETISITDELGDNTVYYRDGTMLTHITGVTPDEYGLHAFDLTSADYNVDGALACQAEVISDAGRARRALSPIVGGRIKSDPKGISCGLTCSHLFPRGSTVVFTAVHKVGFRFHSWSGACRTFARHTCTLVMGRDQEFSASFRRR